MVETIENSIKDIFNLFNETGDDQDAQDDHDDHDGHDHHDHGHHPRPGPKELDAQMIVPPVSAKQTGDQPESSTLTNSLCLVFLAFLLS